MPESVTQSQFYDAMRDLSDKMQDYHRRGREHIDAVGQGIQDKLDKHVVDDNAVERRVAHGEDVIARHEHDLAQLNRTVLNRRRSDKQGQGEAWTMAFTKREGALIGLGFTIIMFVLEVLKVVGAKLWHVTTGS